MSSEEDDDDEFFSVDGEGIGVGVLEDALDDVGQWSLDPFEEGPRGGVAYGSTLESIAEDDRAAYQPAGQPYASEYIAGDEPWARLASMATALPPPQPLSLANPVDDGECSGRIVVVDFRKLSASMRSEAVQATPPKLLISVGSLRQIGEARKDHLHEAVRSAFIVTLSLTKASKDLISDVRWPLGSRDAQDPPLTPVSPEAAASADLPMRTSSEELAVTCPPYEPCCTAIASHPHVEVSCPSLPILVSASGWGPMLEVGPASYSIPFECLTCLKIYNREQSIQYRFSLEQTIQLSDHSAIRPGN